MKIELPLAVPGPDATDTELRDHFSTMNNVFACTVYNDAIHMCLTCGKLDENTLGKADSPSGRSRFCSQECMDTWTRNRERMKKAVAK